MKMSLVAVCMLILVFCSSIHSGPIGADTQNCCISYVSKPIPSNLVKQYYFTGDMCSKPAVIFTITKNRQYCADPELSWVKRNMKHFNMRRQ
ncbi:C-C motif chemokine 5-like isoform 1-T1 [Discoglossus pictus]